MYCFKVSEEEARQFWDRMASHNAMELFVPWCIYLYRIKAVEPCDYFIATMHHWDEYIAFLARKKIQGEYRESKR